MSARENKYNMAFEQIAHLQPIFPEEAKRQMAELIEVIVKSNENIDSILATNQLCAVKGGYIAEEWVAETFNLDAILKGADARAITDRYEGWSNLEWNGVQLKKNDNVLDIVITRNDEIIKTAQSKMYCSPEQTSEKMSQVHNGQPKYERTDVLLGPKDQVNPTLEQVPGESQPVTTTPISEHAQAKADALKSQNGDPAQVAAYENTAEKCSDVIQDGDVSSTPLTKKEADNLGSGDKSRLQEIEGAYKSQSTLQQMGRAGINAAALSAIVCGTVNTLRYIQLAKEGKLTVGEATIKILGETAASAADSALKASINTGAQSLMVRYGSEQAAMQILTRQGLKGLFKTSAVTAGVTYAIDLAKDIVLLGMGKITKEQLYERQGKNILNTSAGTVGATLGTAAAGGLSAALGLQGSVALVAMPIIGGLSGGLIAGLAMSFAIENGIERPYRELVSNTEELRETTLVLEDLSRTMFRGQALFSQYLEADFQMETMLQYQMKEIDRAGDMAVDAINRI